MSPRTASLVVAFLVALLLLAGVVAVSRIAPTAAAPGSFAADGGAPALPPPPDASALVSSGSNVYYVGAQAPTSVCNPTCTYLTNSGARTTVQVVSLQVTGCLSYWIGDDSAANLWGQVGYYICSGSTPYAFYQIWNLGNGSALTTGTATVSPGSHTFSIYSQSGGNTWAFALDGNVFGTYDLGASVSLGTYPVQAVSEEGLVSGSWTPPQVTFSTAIETLQTANTNPIGSGWVAAASAFDPWGGCTSTGVANNSGGYTCWGVAGNLQSPSIQPNSIVTGGSVAPVRSGTSLWNGAAPDFTLTANPTSLSANQGAAVSSTISVSPLSGFTGSVSLTASVSPAAGLTCTLSPTLVSGGSGTSTLSCSGTTGIYAVTVTGTSGSLSHTTSVTFNVSGGTALIVSFTLVGGGTGYSAPTLTYVQGGLTKSTILTTAAVAYAVDPNSSWSVTNPLSGSSSSERWQTSHSTSGVATTTLTISFRYYHQVLAAFTYAVKGGGSGYSVPSVAYSNFSAPANVLATGAWVWADSASLYQYQNPLSGSNTTTSWQTNNGVGTVGTSGVYAATYRHQYKVKFAATTLTGGAMPDSPLVNVTVFGSNVSLPADNVSWVDAGGTFSFPAVFYGPLPGERWITTTPPSGLVLAPMTITAAYAHQYYLQIQINAPQGGTVTGTGGWYNATTSLTLEANAEPGWRFQGWIGSGTGSYSGASTNASVTLDAPVTETAVFDVRLTLIARGGGSLQYSYGGTTGWVPPGSTTTLYLAPGTNVSVQAAPSLFYQLDTWGGSATGSRSAVVVVADTPQTLTATFGVSLYSQVDSLLGVALLATAVVALALSVRRHRRKKREHVLRAQRVRERSRA